MRVTPAFKASDGGGTAPRGRRRDATVIAPLVSDGRSVGSGSAGAGAGSVGSSSRFSEGSSGDDSEDDLSDDLTDSGSSRGGASGGEEGGASESGGGGAARGGGASGSGTAAPPRCCRWRSPREAARAGVARSRALRRLCRSFFSRLLRARLPVVSCLLAAVGVSLATLAGGALLAATHGAEYGLLVVPPAVATHVVEKG
jgi:hypothetical protein